jgi:hypothetical protein
MIEDAMLDGFGKAWWSFRIDLQDAKLCKRYGGYVQPRGATGLVLAVDVVYVNIRVSVDSGMGPGE